MMISNYSSFGFGYDSDSQYDVAQICLNGHLINDATKKSPDFSSKYCRKCGQSTIDHCPFCNVPIKGRYHSPGTPWITSSKDSPVPLYCHDCGKPYPWTQATLDTAMELVSDEDGLTETDKTIIAENLPHIIAQTPRTPLAASRIKKVHVKMSEVGQEGFKQLLADITTESAKVILWDS